MKNFGEYWKRKPSKKKRWTKKKEKSSSSEEKTSRNQILQQKYNNKLPGSPFRKIFWIILETDAEGTQTNGLKDKEVDEDSQDLSPERWHRQTECVQKRRNKRTNQYWGLRGCSNSRTREIYQKKNKDWMITAVNNSNGHTRSNSKTTKPRQKKKKTNNYLDISSDKLPELHTRWDWQC